MADGTVTIDITADGSQATKELDDVQSKAEDASSSIGDKLGGAFGKVAAAIAAAGIVDKIKDISTQAINAASEMEQNIGGVQKLFGDNWRTVQQNADAAYKTAGVSANTYMQQVTSFSASLISSLGGDTAAAAELADMAVVQMSDNANIFGSNIEDIQNAYQGFAKQNYTMLDNLKLGYGGTQSEMERLIQDASELTDVQDQLGLTVDANSMSFDNIIKAIQVMQTEMGIAGDTAAEADQTFAGSMASMQAAYENFLAALANPEGDNIGETLTALLDSVMTFANNAIPMVQAIGDQIIAIIPDITAQIGPAIEAMAPQLGAAIGTLIGALVTLIITLLPSIVTAAVQLFSGLITGLMQAMPQITAALIAAMPQLVSAITQGIPQILQAGMLLFAALITAVAQSAPEIVSAIIQMIPQLVSAFSSAGPQLLEAGKAIMQSFLDGLKSVWGKVTDFVGGIGSWIAEHKGPVQYDRKLLVPAGTAIMRGFGDALKAGFDRYVGDYVPTIGGNISGAFGSGYGGTISRSITVGTINISAANAIEAGSVEGIIEEALRKTPAWGGVY